MSVARLTLALLLTLATASQQTPARREHFSNADVLYDWVTNDRGEKLRTYITRPKNVHGKVPAIFFVGWLSCDTMESPDPKPDDGFGILLGRLIDRSGFATVRMDKPGVGESQGDCAKADLQSELTGWQAAFDSMSKYDFIGLDRVFVVGLRSGGGPVASQRRRFRSTGEDFVEGDARVADVAQALLRVLL